MELEYSIDKVKLYIHGLKIEDVKILMNDLLLDMNVKAYESKSLKACRYNYIISENDTIVFDTKLKGNTFYLGIEPNWSKDKNKRFRDIVIEYNPNKIHLKRIRAIDSLMPINEYKTEIMSLDVAVDLYGIGMNDLLVYKRHGNEFFSRVGHSEVETHYLGAFGENGHIKIYNKAKEQKMLSDEKWTRYEITYKKLGFMDIRDIEVINNTKLAEVKIIDKNISLEKLKDTERVLMLATIDNPDYINMLGRVMRSKIKRYHNEYLRSLDISRERITETYKNFKVI